MIKNTKVIYFCLFFLFTFTFIINNHLCFPQITEENSQPKVSNVFIETDLRQALRDISAQAQVPIICDDTVRGIISIELKDVELEEALNIVLAPYGYVYKKIKNYYLIGSPAINNPSFRLLSETEIITLNYRKAQEVMQLLSRNLQEYIKVDTENNALIITAPHQIITCIKENIKHIDKPVPQIMIESMVLEISKEGRKELGIDPTDISWKNKLTLEGGKKKPQALSYVITAETQRQNLFNILNFLIKEGKAEIKACPRVLTLNGHKASIYAGKENYVPLITGRPGYEYTTLEKIKEGVNLEITPYVGIESNQITVVIEPQVSEIIGKGLEGYPIINLRKTKTIVRVKNNETIIIGGLTSRREIVKTIRIPILGKIPLLKLLFSHAHKTTEETEVLVFITPHILPNL